MLLGVSVIVFGLLHLTGDPTRLLLPLEVPAGCRFHPRCPAAFDRCRVERPVPRAVGVGHQAACHLYD